MIKADDKNEINDFIKAAYYNQIGEYKRSNEVYEKVLNNKGGTWPWVYENAKFARAVNYLNLGDVEKAKKHVKELNERYTEIINPMLKHPELSNVISELEKEINLNNRVAVNKFIESPPKFENAGIFEAEYNYYLGVYHFNNSDLTKAEDYFLKAMQFTFDQIISNSSSYLINIYKNKTVTVKKVEYLLDKINDLDDERLEFSAEDLEAKYNL